MRRLLSALLILILATSHGPMGASIPHHDAQPSHGLANIHDHTHGADRHERLSESSGAKKMSDQAPVPAGSHHHVVGDAVASADADFALFRLADDRQRPTNDAALTPTSLTPIPEPPIA